MNEIYGIDKTNKKKPPGTASLITILAGMVCYFGTAAYALIHDDMIVGCAFIIFTFAAIAALVAVNKHKDRKKAERLLKYGDEPVLVFESLSLPEKNDGEDVMLSALKTVAGEDIAGDIMKLDLTGAETLEAIYERGGLIKLGKDFTARQLTDGINARLKSSGLYERLPGLIENDIVSDQNEFAQARRADGLDTSVYDLNAAAYLLRQNGIEPALLYPRTPPVTAGKLSGNIYIALVPTEEMYELCRLCDRDVPPGADGDAAEVTE